VDNLIPGAYRGVAVAWVDGPFTADALVAHLTGREAYRRTRWIVARSRRDGATALVAVHRPASEALFSPIVSVEVLAGPDETCFLERHELDTAVPAQLARATEDPAAAGARCVVVHGRYGHVSFVLDPRPVRIRVREVLPPAPAKLLDQAQRVLDVAEDLPPILLEAEEFSLADHVPAAGPVLLPCRGADIDLPGRDTWFLDERPPHHDWTLLGCARSREIHQWFYGEPPAGSVDLCPRELGPRVLAPGGGAGPLLTKCCLLEDKVEMTPGLAVVPWGSTLGQIGDALAALAREVEPLWAPA